MLKTTRSNFDRHEARRDRRYSLPPIDVTLPSGTYTTENWSLGGFLLPSGTGAAPGAPVSGRVTMPDGIATYDFRADIVRSDVDGDAFRFAQPSGELIGALDRAIASRLFRKRA